ncbi:MAG: O-antigen ligase domain-containing protein [Intrasporangium sp.]|uniref:O-antigen ligase family protein n=1 Tax=Intrasporangium sp. TaxID=1925024 RepID=UPI002649586D|nr:O-antigen ligase domain-containing protein [Intrasporangium sp.]MDN5795494.1 O-antigen ligase domain-containing protein [Intrasporangium sp.]
MTSYVGPSHGPDAVSILTTYLCLLLAIPAPMVVPALGSAGAPAMILALGAFCWWLWFHIHRDEPLSTGRQPVRAAVLAWLLVMLIVYAHAMAGPMVSDEISPADSGVLRLVGLCGLVLVANDGIPSLERHHTLARRIVLGAGIVALLGLFQLVTRRLWVDEIRIPGLTSASEWTIARRNGLVRPSGTATHPIEYGMVLTCVLPLAMAFARSSPTRRWLFRLLLGAIGIVVMVVISRSALICGAVAVVVMVLSWPLMAKLKALLMAAGMVAILFLTAPGVLTTITDLFTGIEDDPSVASRTGSYDLASEFISRSPILGRGFGTFLPKYWILDNGYLGLLIEGGVLGLGGLLVLIVAALILAHRAARLATNEFEADVARALTAGVAAGAAGLAFFDTFGFPQSAGAYFLLVGMSGALWRLSRDRVRAEATAIRRTTADQPNRTDRPGRPMGSPR